MRNLLLDTHILLWWLFDQPLVEDARRAVSEPRAKVFVSVASLWEISIKQGLGRLEAPESVPDAVLAEGFELLGITSDHTSAVRDLPPLHRDPFDRMLVVQAQVEDLVLVTRDAQVTQYAVRTMMA